MKITRFKALFAAAATAAATALTLSACSNGASTTAGTDSTPRATATAPGSGAESGKNDDAATAAPATSAAAAGGAAAPAAGACGAANLAARFEPGGAGGGAASGADKSAAGTYILTLTNSSQAACTLHPDVDIELKDAAGDGVSENLELSSQAGSIAPGSSVSWTVAVADPGSVPGCAPAKPATHLEVDIEDGGEDIDIPVDLTGCQDDDIDLLSEVR